MNVYPIWHIHVEESLVKHDGSITQEEECACQVMVFLWYEFVHVRETNADTATLAESDSEEPEDIELDVVGEGHYNV